MTQVESDHRVYQSSLPELFERLENLAFAGETQVDHAVEVYSVALSADSRGEFHVLRPQSQGA